MDESDEWFSQSMNKIDEVLTSSQNTTSISGNDIMIKLGNENVQGDNGVNRYEGEEYDDESDEADSLDDVDPMTDDEEFINNRKWAAEVRKKKAIPVPIMGANRAFRKEHKNYRQPEIVNEQEGYEDNANGGRRPKIDQDIGDNLKHGLVMMGVHHQQGMNLLAVVIRMSGF